MVDKISDLKEGKSVTIKGKVLETSEVKTVQTKYGPRELSEAVIGDETGKVRVTLWGDKAGTLKEGEVVEIRDGWTTSFRGEVKVNVNQRSEIEVLNEEGPSEDEIPDNWPKAEGRDMRRRPRNNFRGSRRGSHRNYRKEF
ncbi:single-stranded DNA-binding protein [Ignicoccus islandicus DSM 13165]|uniref:Single-stranded DNA-binding protein n=1 Tax=Ignicoccus islandicus DSM 13165 TaxID=940295 RepID=A0A0U3F235_9CREN|nr:OB-fold nucleic acid binding domain-containing protein [Ignicoccus islandicus]ALU11621.1 single-stranded DNA-binding protein [Ignicoccus islandicus DSM 13165]